MKVKEVIEKLKEFSLEAEVYFECGETCPSVDYLSVEVIEQDEESVVIKQY